MSIQTIATLKNWYKTGLKPLQLQFWDWLDSYWHKSDKIPIDTIDGLDEILNNLVDLTTINNLVEALLPVTLELSGDDTYLIPNNGRLLCSMLVLSDTEQSISVSKTIGGKEIFDKEVDTIPAGGNLKAVVTMATGETIYFTDITMTLTVKLYFI